MHFFLNGLWRLLKNGHLPVKLHSSAPPPPRVVYCQRWHQQTCLPSWRKESSVRVYARYVPSETLCGSKDKNTRQLACEIACESQTGSLAYFSAAVRNGTKETTSFLDRNSTSSNMQTAAFAVPLCKDKQC